MMHDTATGAIRVTVEDGVAWIAFDRPDKLNAFTSQAYGELRDAIRMAELNPEIDIAVLTGSGRAFATGGDLSELLDLIASSDPLALVSFADTTPMSTIRDAKLGFVDKG